MPNVEFSGQLHLGFAGSPRETQQPIPFHPPLFFGRGEGKMLGAKGSDNEAVKTALFGDDGKGLKVLGHGPLPENLTGDDKGGSFFFQELSCSSKHEGVAIDAGIHVSAVAVLRLSHNPQVRFCQIDNLEGKKDLCR